MLEFLKIYMSNPHTGDTALNIWYRHGILRYVYDGSLIQDMPNITVRIPGVIADRFLEDLDEMHITRWKKLYAQKKSTKPVLGCRWLVIYKDTQSEPKKYTGMDAYPAKWPQFLELINRLVTESEAARLNHLAGIELTFHQQTPAMRLDIATGRREKIMRPYTEALSIDRKSEKMVYSKKMDEQVAVSYSYQIQGLADQLLGNAELYFQHFRKMKALPDSFSGPRVQVDLRYRNGRHARMVRSYDRYGLPDDWVEFLDDMHGLMAHFGLFGGLFDQNLYQHGVKKGEYIYLSCMAGPGSKSVFYRTNDDSLKVGDLVLVPVKDAAKNKDSENIMLVSEILYCTSDNVPKPLESTSFIIGKYDLGGMQALDRRDDEDDENDEAF